ncbi:unnamed protein product [Mytilus coruscus]|uniref:Uncharacterized protein n=1 Tax=Mytilus coruscus TaxID=42192 RepID=A0A6J8BAV6_MYTCO|nr:unnamed protein product [Mytilus coruscus]
MMLIFIKANNDILNEDVIKIVDIEILAGMPLGTTVQSIVFSFIEVFFLELVTGIFGIWGVIGRKKRVLAVIAGVGLLGVGITLLSDEFLNNSSLKHIFYKLQFQNYYFYDILVGLAAASVVLGTLTSTVAVLGLVGSWKKSPGLLVMLQCCGVNYYNETFYAQGIIHFCCKNAHPRILDSNEYSTNSYTFDYFGGCGGFKTDTCADVILLRTEMFVGWFLAIVLLQIVLEIIGVVFVNKEYLVIVLTKRSEDSTGEALNLRCALLGKMFRGIKSFSVNNWKR